MSRKCRVIVDGGVYHIYNKINACEYLLADSETKDLFLKVLTEAKKIKEFRFRIKNLTIMNNHIHMQVKMDHGENLSKVMQWIFSVFAQRYNRKYSRKGHLWIDRFKSKVIESITTFEKVFEYITNNPVKAGIVNHAEDYEYGVFHISRKWIGLIDF